MSCNALIVFCWTSTFPRGSRCYSFVYIVRIDLVCICDDSKLKKRFILHFDEVLTRAE